MSVQEKAQTPSPAGLAHRVRYAWARDSHLSLVRRLQKAAQFAGQLLRAKVALRDCDRVGARARVAGRLRVENHGRIIVGDHLNINSSWIPTELLTGREGRIVIGDEVLINFGAMIAAARGVTIGSGSMIGPHCILSDLDVPEQVPLAAPEEARPIHIGRDVWLAGRVTVRPGVRIGDGAVIAAGSVVESDIPAHVMAGGIPARLLPKLVPGQRAGTPSRLVPDFADGAAAPPAAGVARRPLTGDLIADFPLDDLINELRLPDAYPPLAGRALPWSGVTGTGVPPPAGGAADFAVVWTRPEAAVPGFAQVLDSGTLTDDAAVQTILAGVDAYCAWVQGVAERYGQIFLPTWTLPGVFRGHGYRDLRPGGAAAVLAKMNMCLMDHLGGAANIHVLNAARWQASIGAASFNPRAWYLGRIPMARPFVAEAALEIRAAMAALQGASRRLLVLGFEGTLSLGAAAPAPAGVAVPEAEQAAWADLQRDLRRLQRNDVALAVLARAGEPAVRAAVRGAPGALLRESDIGAWQFDVSDEPAAVAALAARLSVPLASVAYIDTHSGARMRVREKLPAVYVPDWPGDPLLQPAALAALRCFDHAGATVAAGAGGVRESAA